MAQRTIQANFKRFLDQHMEDIGYLAGLGDNVVFDLKVGGPEFVNGIRKGMAPILKAHRLTERANTIDIWTNVTRRAAAVIKRFPPQLSKRVRVTKFTPKTNKPGVYLLKATKLTITFRIIRQRQGSKFITGDNRVAQLATGYRDLAYKFWLKEIEQLTRGGHDVFGFDTGGISFTDKVKYESKQRGSTEKTVKNIIAQNTNVAHREGTTVADLGMKALEESKPTLHTKIGINAFDIIDYAKKNLGVTFYKNDGKKKVGSYTFDTLVEARLAYNRPGSEQTDKKANIAKFEDATAKFIENALSDPNNKFHKLLVGVSATASKSPRKRASDDVVEDIIKPFTKKRQTKTRLKKKTKKFKNESRKIQAKTPKNTKAGKITTSSLTLSGTVARPRQQERKKVTTNQKLARLINKRLPAEVRRNMGKPALTNRTGRFSNSVELKSLRDTSKGLSGEYSYLLNPYETFENTGSKRWPTGYNPKPLIAKSIRNLAMQYTEEKLTSLRRT